MHHIKTKSPAKFLWNEQNVFVGGFISFSISSFSGGITMKKSLPDIGSTTIQDVAPLAHMEPGMHHEQWAYTSNFVQYISGF